MNQDADKYVIGLTGTLDSGYPAVSGMLARLGADIIDADAVAIHAPAEFPLRPFIRVDVD